MAQSDYCRRALPRWSTRFGRIVGEIGVPRIARALASDPDLKVTNRAIYSWVEGHAPRPDRAAALVRLSDGKLTLDVIYGHKGELDRLRRTSGDGWGAELVSRTDFKINVNVDSAALLRRLPKAQKRLAYAVVNAINQTAKHIQRSQRERVEDQFTIRKPEFIRRVIAKIRPFASVKQGRAFAEVFVDEKPRLLLSDYERGAERKPATPGARFVAEPVIGGPARPTFKSSVPAEFRMKRLNFDPMKSGKPRAAVAKTKTFLVPNVGIFQRQPGDTSHYGRPVYFFTRGRRLQRRLEWVRTANRIAEKWFPEYLQREVVKAIQHDKGRSF